MRSSRNPDTPEFLGLGKALLNLGFGFRGARAPAAVGLTSQRPEIPNPITL